MSLYEASIFFRKLFKFLLVGLAAVVAVWILWQPAISLFHVFFPAEETPTVRFGKISPPSLPSNPTSGLSFILDTADGKLPTLKKVLPVYQFARPQANVLDLDRAGALAANFKFGSPQQLDNQKFRYTDPARPAQEIQINIVSKNFVIVTNNFADPSVPKSPPVESSDALIQGVRSLLKSSSLLPDDIVTSKAKVTYLAISGNSLIPARSLSEANYARIDIFRGNIKDFPIVTPTYSGALVYLILSGVQFRENQIVEGSYIYWPYSPSDSSTYPLRTAATAWQDLQTGHGSLIIPAKASFTQVRIKTIALAYFETYDYQPYLEPIYLFSGVGVAEGGAETEAIFYLPAVDSNYLGQ
jgi:hypothetical protein